MAPHAEEPTALEAVSKKFGLKIIPNGDEVKTVTKDNGNIPDTTESPAVVKDSEPESKVDAQSTEKPAANGESDSKVDSESEAADGERVKEVVKIKDEEVGATNESKEIYYQKDESGEYNWMDKYPEDVPEAAENEETMKYAVIVRKKKSTDSRKKFEVHSLIIQSPWLRKALTEVLEDYPGVSCDIKRLVFYSPFKPFVHRWASFLKYMARDDLDETTKEHLEILHEILVEEIGTEIKEFEDYVLNGIITFDTLWMIMQPGSLIVAAHRGPESAFEVVDSEYIETQCGRFLQIESQCVDWNGKTFGRCTETINVPAWKGTKKITTLKAVPMALREDRDQLKLALISRGKKFEALGGYCYRSYTGQAITWNQQMEEQTIYVTGRIVVDVDSFQRYTNYPYRYVEDFNEKDVEMLVKYNESIKPDMPGREDESDENSRFLNPSEKKQWNLKLTPYHLMLCRTRTRGYSLKLKKWLEFFVPLIEDIKWTDTAFNSLVLPEDQKELVLSFAESQVLNRDTFDDVISGKGKGVIMLLAGPPGVGKTLTAEAVAEHMRCPLHSITSGDLGSHPREVEYGLSRTLDLVSRWNAILLIDECDVFLEARSAHDLERNKTVSIFLRTLEYYEGILFMTTNRSDNIDSAFQSRIHVSMEYPDLTAESRQKIWANFVKPMGKHCDLTDSDFQELAAVQLNGRQIKNVLKTAGLLAARKKINLSRGTIETVLAIEKRRPARLE